MRVSPSRFQDYLAAGLRAPQSRKLWITFETPSASTSLQSKTRPKAKTFVKSKYPYSLA